MRRYTITPSAFFKSIDQAVIPTHLVNKRVSWVGHGLGSNEISAQVKMNNRKTAWLYWISGIVTSTAILANQFMPEEGSYVRGQFKTFAYASPSDFAKWSCILMGTGFAGAFAKQDFAFHMISDFVEHHMAKYFHTEFEENLMSNGKRRVYFRGETFKEAESVLKNNRSPLPWSLVTGEPSLPAVIDATLHPNHDLPSGYTTSVISLTSDLKTAEGFGRGEAVLVIVPTQQRLAPVSQHAFIRENDVEKSASEYEYISGGVHKNDVLGVGYHDLETGKFCRFELNPAFTGNIDDLELDSQMEPLIALLPDHNPNKAKLSRCIDPKLRYQAHYEDRLAQNVDQHAARVSERKARLSAANTCRFFNSAHDMPYYHSPVIYSANKKRFGR